MTIDDDLLRLGETPAGVTTIRPLGQIRLRAEELRRVRRRRTLAGGTAGVAGVGVVTLLVTGLPGALLSSRAVAGPGATGAAGARTLPPCQADPTSTGAPSTVPAPATTVSTSDPAPPTSAGSSAAPPVSLTGPVVTGTAGGTPTATRTSGPTGTPIVTGPPADPTGSSTQAAPPPTATATAVEPDPGVPWKVAPQLLHVLGKDRPVEARMDEVTPLDCRDTPPTVYAGADRGANGTVRAALAVDGPWPQQSIMLPDLQRPVQVRGATGVLASWQRGTIDSDGVLVLAWQEPGTRQWWQVRSSGLSRSELVAAATALDLKRPATTVPKRFTALPLQPMSIRTTHYWQVTYRRTPDTFVNLSVTDGDRDDSPFARLADVQADRIRLVDTAGGTAFFLPHDNGDTPSVYLVRDGLRFQVMGESYQASLRDLTALEHVAAADPRLKGVPPSYLGPDPS